ncbi:MAG: proton-conducting transporter membrane subunit [Crocinitomicaceae bacterium]
MKTPLIINFGLALLPFLLLLTFVFPKNPSYFKRTFKYVITVLGLSLFTILILAFINFENGTIESDLVNFQGLGLELRFDALSIIMVIMICIIGLIVVQYSKNYLSGESKQTAFVQRLAFTLGCVQILVSSGNLMTFYLAWIGTSIGLHKLLLYYSERPKAQLVARKKFIIARLADVCLLASFIIIYQYFHTGNFAVIFEKAAQLETNNLPIQLEIAGILLMLSASLKSVQIPFHSWILEVMEAPTPVSALLHAGLLNAGPFLIIRFAHLFDHMTIATITLIGIGSMSALFGAMTSAAQTSIKTKLAYSSVGHMGFTLLLCGLGVYSAALLHLVAHSFYKAYSFLSSGSIVDQLRKHNPYTYQRRNNFTSIIVGTLVSFIVFSAISRIWGVTLKTDFQLLFISGIIFLGVLTLQISIWDARLKSRSFIVLTLFSLILINSFFLLESIVSHLLGNQIPEIREANTILIVFSSLVFLSYLTIVVMLSIVASSRSSKALTKWQIHFTNGLYINHFLNKKFNAYRINNL